VLRGLRRRVRKSPRGESSDRSRPRWVGRARDGRPINHRCGLYLPRLRHGMGSAARWTELPISRSGAHPRRGERGDHPSEHRPDHLQSELVNEDHSTACVLHESPKTRTTRGGGVHGHNPLALPGRSSDFPRARRSSPRPEESLARDVGHSRYTIDGRGPVPTSPRRGEVEGCGRERATQGSL